VLSGFVCFRCGKFSGNKKLREFGGDLGRFGDMQKMQDSMEENLPVCD
jgi:hypothetical protein